MPKKDSLPRDKRGVRIDVRGGERRVDRVFSAWHRKNLPAWCYMTDIDFLEYRIVNGTYVPKAIFELKEWHVTQAKYLEDNANYKVIKELCRRLGIPFYVVWVEMEEEKPKRFKVWDVFNQPKEKAKEMDPDEFKKFIENL